MSNNYIIGEIEIKKNDINKDIRIINSFEEYKGDDKLKNKEIYYKYENDKEIREKCQIRINNKLIPFTYFYKFDKEGKYKIEYIFINKIVKTVFMFAKCIYLINLDLSNFNTENVTNMNGMFYGCENLKNIDLSNFNTENVIDMGSLFDGCKNL